MLGHADLATTELYTHVTDRRRRDAYFAAHPHAKRTLKVSAARRWQHLRRMAQLDPHMAMLFALTSGVGYLMIMSGIGKSMLDWKRRRSCPSCGRTPCSCS